ncbi:MAG: DUF6504 family protein [Actinomycetes bacterium]
MTRLYAEPVEVRRAEDAPAQFLWRGRLYVVREVLATWLQAGEWWRGRPPAGADASPDAGPVLDDGEREYWRVEAAAGRTAARGVYDLCFDWSTGAWTLTRTMD